jgi:putative acetyltransferase
MGGVARPDVVIRPEGPGDVDAVRRVVEDAFSSSVQPDLVERIRASVHYVPELALVAEVGREVVGHVVVSHCWLRRESGTATTIATLSPLAVAPDHQRSGIGSLLVRSVLAAADARDVPLVVLEGDPRYYSRFGFEPASAHGIEVPLPDWAPPQAAQVALLAASSAADLHGAVVVYSEAFDGLE